MPDLTLFGPALCRESRESWRGAVNAGGNAVRGAFRQSIRLTHVFGC